MKIAKVLLVDDEDGFLDVMTRRLEKRDLEIQTANSGEKALAMLGGDHGIDVVILDVKMPVMDGIQALREIKKACPLVEVVMLTGHATVETAIEGMRHGAFDYLMKPCDIEQLVRKVAEAKEKRDKHQEKILQAQMREITGRMV